MAASYAAQATAKLMCAGVLTGAHHSGTIQHSVRSDRNKKWPFQLNYLVVPLFCCFTVQGFTEKPKEQQCSSHGEGRNLFFDLLRSIRRRYWNSCQLSKKKTVISIVPNDTNSTCAKLIRPEQFLRVLSYCVHQLKSRAVKSYLGKRFEFEAFLISSFHVIRNDSATIKKRERNKIVFEK